MSGSKGDGLDDLRIPLDKIKFGKKLEVQGYGTVFEGEYFFDADDYEKKAAVALKQLNITNLANIKPKLLDEILRISRFRQHPNVVALLGFCDERSNEIILVYEYVGGGNLADKMRKRLNTIQRLEICLDAARGLDYLHTGVDDSISIVHGNIKPSKILLLNSGKLEAKVSSFGLSKTVPGQKKNEEEIKKTSRKECDVYCFGVMLLEVLCGVSELVDTDDYQERHVSELVPKLLLRSSSEQQINNKLRKIVHFDIRKEIKAESLETYAKIACQCVLENPEARPTMPQVVQQLESALRLQGGKVSYVNIPAIKSMPTKSGENTNIVHKHPQEDTNNATEEEEARPDVPTSKSVEDGERSLPSMDMEAGAETSINHHHPSSPTAEKEKQVIHYDSITNNHEYSNVNINLENDDYEQNKTVIISTNDDPNTTQKLIHNVTSNSNDLSNIIAHDTTQLSSNPDTHTSQDVQNSRILNPSSSRYFNNLPNDDKIGDGLEHLRIPFEKITFGKKIDVRGYGSIFEGEFDQRPVALKRLNITNLVNIKPKLLAEILKVAKFKEHPNLVAFIGLCDEKRNEITLVFEYVSSENLADKMSKHLNTIQRLEICLGAARGIHYLHCGVDDSTPGIIHGDVKLSKILLNSDSNSSTFKAKVLGFGLTKLLPGGVQISPKSIDPVYEATGMLTKESDIYSFGVLLLEVLCGVPELVDTDDYQERHVTELVPKRLEQNTLRKIVHSDIRDEVTTESLETYAKIACQCVLKNPKQRPNMAEVVTELEKALRLQAKEVSTVQTMVSSDGSGLSGGTVEEDAQGNGETIHKDIEEEGFAVKIASVVMDRRSSGVSVLNLNNINGESVPADKTHTENSQKESGNNMLMNFNDPDTTKEVIDELNSNNTSREHEDDNQSTKLVMSSESSNGDTKDHSTKHEMHKNSSRSSSRNFDNLPYENKDGFGDEMENLRIPFSKMIKFGKQIDVRGYGSIFEGEFDNQHVVLKRLNITNLGNIKPKLLTEILMIARFRKHPNLVTLIGYYCDEKSNDIILVYEYISSGNLADNMSKQHLTTIQRIEICLDAARGLDYLHTHRIIHGNIRLSKILLNSDSTTSKFKAKLSGFGLSKQLPGHVQIAPRSIDPMYEEVTGKLTKESDIYSFGVLMLEVLCGVPELVDTDDYQERHVTELVPKRLEQNMLQEVVQLNIRDEITTQSLETYARIACRCVIKNPEERPTMAEVVIELEKALRLQGGEVFYVQILGRTNSNLVPEGGIVEEEDIADEGREIIEETIDDDVAKQQGESFVVQILGSANGADITEDDDDKIENDESTNDPNSKEEITIGGLTSNEQSNIIVEKEDDHESKIITSSDSNNGDYDNSDMQEQSAAEKMDQEDGTKDKNRYALKMSMDDPESDENEDDNITETEITVEVQTPTILDSGNENAGNHCSVFETEKKPELIVDTRGDTSDFSVNDKLIKNQDVVSKRSTNSTCSESSNGDDTTPLDSLLQKSPSNGTTMKKTSTNCCSWWCYLFDRITGQGSSKGD